MQIKVIFLHKNINFFLIFDMKNAVKQIFPEKIRCIAVTAPAGFAQADKLAEAVELLNRAVKVKSFIAERSGNTPDYLAADADDRLAMFNAAVNDPEVDMILAVRDGRSPEVPPTEAAYSVRIVNAVYESARTGKPVLFD